MKLPDAWNTRWPLLWLMLWSFSFVIFASVMGVYQPPQELTFLLGAIYGAVMTILMDPFMDRHRAAQETSEQLTEWEEAHE